MIVQKQLEHFKKTLHEEIDLIFDIANIEDPNLKLSINDFSKKSEQFYKKYYKLCKDTNDVLFENDLSVPLVIKERYRNAKSDNKTLRSDIRVMPILEVLNMISSPGNHDYKDFSSTLVESIKFLFNVYCFIYSVHLPKWLKTVDDIKNLTDPAIQLKKLLNSLGEDIVFCFRTAKIDDAIKIPLTMLYSTEIQDRVNIRLAEYLSAEELAFKVTIQMIEKHRYTNTGSELDFDTVLDSLQQANKLSSGKENERLQIAYHRLIKIMIDVFMSNLASNLLSCPLKPEILTTETKMKLIDLKHGLIRELEQEFDRIK